ncbi:MAG: outer membrane beta-barrel protein, partial [Bacteroidota bacterium]
KGGICRGIAVQPPAQQEKRRKWRLGGFLLLALLIVGLMGWWLYSNSSTDAALSNAQTIQEIPSENNLTNSSTNNLLNDSKENTDSITAKPSTTTGAEPATNEASLIGSGQEGETGTLRQSLSSPSDNQDQKTSNTTQKTATSSSNTSVAEPAPINKQSSQKTSTSTNSQKTKVANASSKSQNPLNPSSSAEAGQKDTTDAKANTKAVEEEKTDIALLRQFPLLPIGLSAALTSPELDLPYAAPIEPFRPRRPARFQWGLSLGSLFYPGASDEYKWLGLVGGWTSRYRLSRRWGLNAELLYQYRRGQFMNTNESEQVVFGFGREGTVHQLRPENLHYLQMPIYVDWRMGKHAVSAGVVPTLLTGARGELLQLTNGQLTSQTKHWIQLHGLRSFRMEFLLAYQWVLTERLGLRFRMQYSPQRPVQSEFIDLERTLLRESGHLTYQFGINYFLRY